MIRIILFFIFVASFQGCNAQDQNTPLTGEDSLKNKPQTKIIVNKEYDENGNLVGFDSTYSYFYSNAKQDTLFGDSTFAIFRDDFYNKFPLKQRPFLNDLFFEDSLLSYDFYKDDFFTKRFQLNRKRFDKLFEKMDSMKNNYYKDFEFPEKEK